MDRRTFVRTSVLSLLAAPGAALAQPATGKVWRIGFLYQGQKIDAVAY